MSDTAMPVSHYVNKAIFILLVAGVTVFGLRACRNYQDKKEIGLKLSEHVSESAAYEQFYQENARKNLLLGLLVMKKGRDLGIAPREMLERALGVEDPGWFSTDKKSELPTRKKLILNAMLSNYDSCVKLGIFEDDENIELMEEGELPVISQGPASGEKAVLDVIIPNDALPGVDKVLPNLILSPPNLSKHEQDSEFRKNRAMELASRFAQANLVDQIAYRKAREYFEKQLAAPKE